MEGGTCAQIACVFRTACWVKHRQQHSVDRLS
jgi:hypothetical protein